MRKIKLKAKEKKFLEEYIKKGTKKARSLKRANILQLLHKKNTAKSISEQLSVDMDTVYNIKKKYLDEGLDSALSEKPRSGQPTKYGEKLKAEIIAKACTTPPKGRKRWSVRLLAEELEKKKEFKTINRESIRLVLKKAGRSLG